LANIANLRASMTPWNGQNSQLEAIRLSPFDKGGPAARTEMARLPRHPDWVSDVSAAITAAIHAELSVDPDRDRT